MAEDAVVTADVPEEEPTPTTGTKSSAALVHDEVNRILKESADSVRQRVVESLVEEKLKERQKMVLDGLGKLKTLKHELAQLDRKGTQNFDLEGKAVGPLIFTKVGKGAASRRLHQTTGSREVISTDKVEQPRL